MEPRENSLPMDTTHLSNWATIQSRIMQAQENMCPPIAYMTISI
jgi:hypothetical protein